MGNGQPRSFKFYRKNEEEVMESLGLKPTKNSGSGWIEKEDGQNDYLICQLKSTDKQSIRVDQKDIRILEKNADVAHKIPIFAIQFLNTGEVWLMAKPADFTSVAEYINTNQVSKNSATKALFDVADVQDVRQKKPKKMIGSSASARNSFFEDKAKAFDKTRKAGK